MFNLIKHPAEKFPIRRAETDSGLAEGNCDVEFSTGEINFRSFAGIFEAVVIEIDVDVDALRQRFEAIADAVAVAVEEHRYSHARQRRINDQGMKIEGRSGDGISRGK